MIPTSSPFNPSQDSSVETKNRMASREIISKARRTNQMAHPCPYPKTKYRPGSATHPLHLGDPDGYLEHSRAGQLGRNRIHQETWWLP